MEFEWDENKRKSNIEKHGFDFREAWKVFEGDYIRSMAKQGKGGEERFLVTGLVDDFYATVIITMRNDICRVISLRKASVNEQRRHQTLHGG